MSGDIGILTGVTIGTSLWDKIKNYASQKEDAPQAKTEAKLLAQASVDLKEERSWWEVLLFGGPSGGGVAGCGYGAEKILNKPRDAGVDGDGGDDGDAGDGDGGVECNNYPGSFNLSSPPDSNSATSLQPYFDWTDSIDPDSGDTVSYSLLIDTDSLFPAPTTYNDISASEFNLTTPLANNTTYYWKVIAKDLCDQETESDDVFNFTTVVACSTSPNSFSLVSPAHGSTNVSLTPTFDWEDSIDPDVGDAVTYTLQVDTSDLFPAPTEFTDLVDSTYTMTSSLANGTTYYWRVIAKDGCDNEVTSTGVYSFTTETECIPQTPIVETEFTSGTSFGNDHLWMPGSVILNRNWTSNYEARSGSLPTDAGWTLVNPSGGSATLAADPVSGEDALRILSIGTDDSLYYSIDPSFDNATGWSIQWRGRVSSIEAGALRHRTCAVDAVDGTQWLRMEMIETSLDDEVGGHSYAMDTTSAMHTYRIEAQSGAYDVYVDGAAIPSSPWAFGGGDIINRIIWGDYAAAEDSDAYYAFFRYYNSGRYAAFNSPSSYDSIVYDLGSANNNLEGLGAALSVTIDTIPSVTSVDFQTRTGNTPTVDGSWSSWEDVPVGYLIQSPRRRYIQIRAILSTTDDSISPRLDEYQINYCTY